MSKLRVGVLRGGISSEYPVSLKTGESILKNLSEEKYLPVDILVTKDGVWHINGMPTDPMRVARRVDVVWNALHGEYGEDGKVQRTLDQVHIPYTGSEALPSALGMNKALAKDRFIASGLKVPRHRLLRAEGEDGESFSATVLERISHEIFRDIHPPWVVKHVSGGSSVDVFIVKNYPDLHDALAGLLEAGKDVLVEEYIRGKEATCGVLDHFRGEEVYALFPTEIRPPKSRNFFDYEAKYGGETEEITPGNFSQEESRALRELACRAHRSIGARHYSRSDFMVTLTGIYILEINTLPGLTGESLIPKALHAVGSSLPEFIDHVITLAMRKR